ncbi:hypothetical protein PMIT1342_01285 [Prochlorococcus marinus str. MIT 1342]|nr:hypothetical protein PMIT1342_01285 [Prochlorococcus marinus str. MIT 1342]
MSLPHEAVLVFYLSSVSLLRGKGESRTTNFWPEGARLFKVDAVMDPALACAGLATTW